MKPRSNPRQVSAAWPAPAFIFGELGCRQAARSSSLVCAWLYWDSKVLGIKDRILLKDGICQRHQPTVVLVLLTLHKHLHIEMCATQQVTSSPAASQPALPGSRSHGMPGVVLSKGWKRMLFLVVLTRLSIKSRSVQGGGSSQEFDFPGW